MALTSSEIFGQETASTVPFQTLKQVADGRLLMGAAIGSDDLRDPRTRQIIARHFDCLTAGNEMKPDHIQPTEGRFTFERADQIVDFAHANGLKVIGHTLLWHQQTPKWRFVDPAGKPLSRELALEKLRTHINTLMKHYAGRVKGWDVVNEALADQPGGYLRDTPAHRAIGDDYIFKAFEFARDADPNAELYYNDYNIDMLYKRDRAVRLVKEIKAAGLRLDAVGIQGHWLLKGPPISEIESGIRAFTDLGVKVMITELDVDPLPRRNENSGADISATEASGLDPYKGGFPPEMQKKLADRYAEIFKVLLANPMVTRITIWGVTDKGTWLNYYPVAGRTNHPLLFDRAGDPKPAFFAVLHELQSVVLKK